MGHFPRALPWAFIFCPFRANAYRKDFPVSDNHAFTSPPFVSIKAFSPQRRKERKGRQEIRTCLLLLSVLSVFAVKILGFGVFLGRLIIGIG